MSCGTDFSEVDGELHGVGQETTDEADALARCISLNKRFCTT